MKLLLLLLVVLPLTMLPTLVPVELPSRQIEPAKKFAPQQWGFRAVTLGFACQELDIQNLTTQEAMGCFLLTSGHLQPILAAASTTAGGVKFRHHAVESGSFAMYAMMITSPVHTRAAQSR